MPAPDEPTRVQPSVAIPALVVEADGQTWRVTSDRPWLIGRATEADIRLEDPRVSRTQATITPTPQGWFLTNDGAGGMFVEGQRVERLNIEQRAAVSLGHEQGVLLRFRVDGAGPAADAGPVEGATQVINVPAAQPSNSAPPDWYPDPAGSGRLRYFSGTDWTDHVAPVAQATPPATPGAGRYSVTLHKHTGLLFLMLRQSYRFEGTLADCERAYRSAQTHNLLAGWWGILSALVFNWIAIFSNVSAINQVRRLARQAGGGPIPVHQIPAGWHPDPSGAPQQRYWDGGNWTDHVQPRA